MTHNDDSNQLYSSFMGEKKENSNIKAESGGTSKPFLQGGKDVLFWISGRRYRKLEATVNVIGSI